ncbi:hypothetical protein X777_03835 [Ooceraea biroi]|uniref:Uncharacterized protein n=1 Tax=Ooceraea biroi TaxID=2015173 RepID=A0A026WHS5_OOCBI|nr:hypothetical protein X777_03835 [Ooceraea biroi]
MKCGNPEDTERPRETGCPKVAQVSCRVFLLLIICCRTGSLAFDNTTDLFLQRCEMECSLRGDFTTCGKYRVVRWLNTVVREKEFSYGPFRIIRIPSMEKQTFLPHLPQSRAFNSSITETLNFIRNSVEDLLTKRAIVYTVDNSATARDFSSLMFVDDDELKRLQEKKEPEGDWRIFKKKKSLILPILILINLIKLKLLLLPIFLGVHFIKKLLVLGSIILPSILAHLKVCKVQQVHTHHSHPFHLWSTAADATADYPSGKNVLTLRLLR